MRPISFALLGLALLLQLILPCLAIQKSLAGKVDWHKPMIGIARKDVPINYGSIDAPGGGKKDVAVVVTEKNVIAALDVEDGGIVWRLKYEVEDVLISYEVDGNETITVSGTTKTYIRSLSLSTGHVIWESLLQPPATSQDNPPQLHEPLNLGTSIAFASDDGKGKGDVLVLSGGEFVTRLERATGKAVWSWSNEASGSTNTQVALSVQPNAILIFSLIQSFASPQLAYISLDLTTGTPSSHTPTIQALPANIAKPEDFIVTANGLAWVENDKGQLRSLSINNSGKLSTEPRTFPRTFKGTEKDTFTPTSYTSLKPISLSSRNYFLALLSDDAADLIKLGEGGKLEGKCHFEKGDLREKSGSVWGGYGGEGEGESWVTRVFWSHGLQLANVQTYNIEHEAGYMFTGGTIPYNDKEHGVILNAALKLKTEQRVIDRYTAIFTTSTGSIQGWKQDNLTWVREESLTSIVAEVTVELPEMKVEEGIEVLDHEGPVERAARHVSQLNRLPTYFTSFISRFTSGSYSKSLSSTPLSKDLLYRDQFGFQKLVVFATSIGKVFAIDSAHGNIVWSSLIALNGPVGSEVEISGMWNVRNALDSGSPMLAVVGTRRRGGVDTIVGYHIDAFTGEVVRDASNTQAFLPAMAAKEIASGTVKEVFPLPVEHCKTGIRALAIVDTSNKVHLFPYCKKIEAGFAKVADDLHISHVDSGLGHPVLRGQGFANSSTGFVSYSTWTLPLGPGEHISHKAENRNAMIASYGRVLGDRTTLYKYLNPHLVACTTINLHASSGTVFVVDSVSGNIVYRAVLDGINTARGVPVVLDENALIYSYAEKDEPARKGKGQRLVTVELFEGLEPNERTDSLSSSSRTGDSKVEAVAQTFIIPIGVKGLAFTASKYSITYRDLILISDRDQVATIPKRLLDPRRPDVPSKRDKEEYLVPYQPFLMVDAKWTLSHTYDVMGSPNVLTSPSLLESTSMLVAYGQDLFGSRVTPSGTFDILSDAFNKTQLLLTILGLGIGILVARPMVARKRLGFRWY